MNIGVDNLKQYRYTKFYVQSVPIELLVEAHKLNPHSKLRKCTLYSAILGEHSIAGTAMPNLNTAFQYVKEYPDGPFIEETYLITANFYKDLFFILEELEEHGWAYKIDCFKEYISKESYSKQIAPSRNLAIQYYTKVLTINPRNGHAKRFLNGLKQGKGDELGWSFCGD